LSACVWARRHHLSVCRTILTELRHALHPGHLGYERGVETAAEQRTAPPTPSPSPPRLSDQGRGFQGISAHSRSLSEGEQGGAGRGRERRFEWPTSRAPRRSRCAPRPPLRPPITVYWMLPPRNHGSNPKRRRSPRYGARVTWAIRQAAPPLLHFRMLVELAARRGLGWMLGEPLRRPMRHLDVDELSVAFPDPHTDGCVDAPSHAQAMDSQLRQLGALAMPAQPPRCVFIWTGWTPC